MSSSQGANSTSVTHGYEFDPDSIKDASDWTKQLKEKRLYYSYNTFDTQNEKPEDAWQKYGNGFRYSYLFGRFKCGGCDGNAFSGSSYADYVWRFTARDSERAWVAITSSSDGNFLAAAVDAGYIYTSVDGGITWVEQTASGSRDWSSITSSSDGTKLAATVDGGYIYTSTDSGVTWTEQTLSNTRVWSDIASSSDGTKLAATVNGGYIYTSIDSGATWTERLTSGSRSWTSIASSSNGNRLVATHGSVGAPTNTVFTSGNSGVSWASRTISVSNYSWVSIASSADGVTFIATASNGPALYISTNIGVSWAPIPGSPGQANSVSCSSDSTKIVTTTSGGRISISLNSGSTWNLYEQTRSWTNTTMSADGKKVAATVNVGNIYTGLYSY